MGNIHRLAPGALVLALSIILAACAQGTASPSQPAPSQPTAPTPSDSPTEQPSQSPEPSDSPGEVVEHELPMIGRVVIDGVEVRTLPSADAPLLTGDRFSDGSRPEIVLAEGDLVVVTLGPVVADGESWYEIRAVDGGDVYFEFGWVPGDALEREGDLASGSPIVVGIDGQGQGASVDLEVPAGTPLTVRFAAVPTDGAESCEIDVTLLRTDGLGVNVATDTPTEAMAFGLAADQLSSLFQEEAGTATLQVETDCSFAANVTQPPF